MVRYQSTWQSSSKHPDVMQRVWYCSVDGRNPAPLGTTWDVLYIKPCKSWDIYHINWCRISSINSKIVMWHRTDDWCVCRICPHISVGVTTVFCALHLHIWVPELQRYSIVPSLYLRPNITINWTSSRTALRKEQHQTHRFNWNALHTVQKVFWMLGL